MHTLTAHDIVNSMSEALLDFDFDGYVAALSPRQQRHLRLVIDQDAELPSVPKVASQDEIVTSTPTMGLSTFHGFAPEAFRSRAMGILRAADDFAVWDCGS